VDAPAAVQFNLHFGQPEQLQSSAVGKALLASLPLELAIEWIRDLEFTRKTRNAITTMEDLLRDLDTTRSRGYSIDDEEDYEGITCIGAHVADHTGVGIGAVSVTALKQQLPNWRIEDIARQVQATAAKISLAIVEGTSAE